MPLVKVSNGTAVGDSAAGPSNPQSYLVQRRANRSQIDSKTVRNGQTLHRSNQSHSRRDSDAGSSESFSSSLLSEEQKTKALGLKMLPPTTSGTLTTQKLYASHQPPNVSQYMTTSSSSEQSGGKHHINVFDDTASLNFEDSTMDENEEVTQVLTGPVDLFGQIEQPGMRQSFITAPRSQPARVRPFGNIQLQHVRSLSLPVREVDDFLKAGQKAPLHSTIVANARNKEPQTAMKDRATQNMDFDVMQAAIDTPSKSRSIIPQHFSKSQSMAKSVKFTEQLPMSNQDVLERESQRSQSPDLPMPQDVPRPARNLNQNMDAISSTRSATPPQIDRVTNQDHWIRLGGRANPRSPTTQHTNTPLLNSEFANLPEARRSVAESEAAIADTAAQLKQSSQKRPREYDLDYDMELLTKKNFGDLYNEAFTFDPHNSPPKSSNDSSGQVVNLAQRLENLTRMSEEEQKKIFQKQNDEEWAETGTWFISKFQEDLKRLMEARLDRRKVSMLYENEIRRRHKDVEWCTAGVANDLNDLKSKGTDLIKTRPGSRNGTPLRERA